MEKFPRRRKHTNRIGKLKEFLENRDQFSDNGFKPLDLELLRWARVLRALRVENSIGGIVIVEEGWKRGWDSSSSRLELQAKISAKRLALDEGVHEEEPGLFFRSGKEE